MNEPGNIKKPSLILCLLMDFIGNLTYFVPFFGEWADIIWAPVSAFIFYRTFSGNTARIGSIVAFFEEALPFVDFVPTFTLGYIYTFLKDKVSGKAKVTVPGNS